MSTQKPSARLWVLLAREAPVGVIFRRGPSKQVLMIKWDTANDTFVSGQWLKGRVYEHRTDLSPDGKLLIYFAANQKPPVFSWTAISKPPYFSALALWPKGDCWNGGGWFVDNREIHLNHSPDEANLDPRFRLGQIKVTSYAEFRGEDDTVWDHIRERDGWKCTVEGNQIHRGGISGWDVNPPMTFQKKHPKNANLALEMSITGIGGKNEPWYQKTYRVLETLDYLSRRSLVRRRNGVDLGRIDWADWNRNGDLVFAKGGCLFRLDSEKLSDEPTQLSDFNAPKFENVAPPPEAQRW